MADIFENRTAGLDSPGSNAAVVTPNDSTDLTTSTRALYVGGTGAIKVDMVGGETVTFEASAVGFMPIRVKRVYSTGTTATNILAIW